ncbi:hypothetical protein [Fictibacillus sp. KU28468]|uniref:hypothetical protein n=1 Tax=Fictibacillus sp. KU28468 TaxID=2991053 RepID=UPI00223CBC40|nr:hypothetical protein [Fictibacillus sp. KU28468]UZJ80558.1 hypothetical protein OKX00_08960 [Fictibacillus sp. KU28468]
MNQKENIKVNYKPSKKAEKEEINIDDFHQVFDEEYSKDYQAVGIDNTIEEAERMAKESRSIIHVNPEMKEVLHRLYPNK